MPVARAAALVTVVVLFVAAIAHADASPPAATAGVGGTPPPAVAVTEVERLLASAAGHATHSNACLDGAGTRTVIDRVRACVAPSGGRGLAVVATSRVTPIADEGEIIAWDDRKIGAGEEWEKEIDAALGRADVAVLAINSHLLSSRYCTKCEVPALLEARAQRGLKMVPVILSDCLWKQVSWLSSLKALPKDGKALPASGVARNRTLTFVAENLAAMATHRAAPAVSPADGEPRRAATHRGTAVAHARRAVDR